MEFHTSGHVGDMMDTVRNEFKDVAQALSNGAAIIGENDRMHEESELDTRSCNASSNFAHFVRMRYVDDVLYKIVNGKSLRGLERAAT